MKKIMEGKWVIFALLMIVPLIVILQKPLKAEAKVINDNTTLTQNTTWYEDVTVNKSLNLNGYKLTIYGNVVANSDVSVGSGGILDVHGNYTQKTGGLNLGADSAAAYITGNYNICNVNAVGEFVQGSGYIIGSKSAVLNVDGSFYFNSNFYSLTIHDGFSGTFNLKGNYTDKVGVNKFTNINMNGSTQQIISLSENSYLNNLTLTNADIKVEEYFSGNLLSNISLKTNASTIKINNGLSMNGHLLTIPCDVIATSTINVGGGGILNVKGNYTQKTGGLNMDADSATAHITGNYNICNINAVGEFVQGSGYIIGSQSAVLNLDGNFYFDSNFYSLTVHDGFSGTFNLKGNYTDKVGVNKFTNINMNGSTQQVIKLSENSYLNNLNPKNTNIKINEYFSGSILGDLKLKTSASTITVNKALYLNGHSLTLPCKVIANSSIYVGGGGILSVNGDYTQTQGGLNINNDSATVNISGNMNVRGIDAEGKFVTGSGYINGSNSSIISISGNFVYDSDFSSLTTNSSDYGTIKIKGNYKDIAERLYVGTVKLVGDVSKTKTQKVVTGKGKIGKLILKSCIALYDISEDCYQNISYTHKNNLGEITKEPTSSAKGVITYKCSYCGAKSTAAIPYKNSVTPPKFSVKSVSGGTKVSWNAVKGVGKYVVFRKKSSGNWKGIGETTETSFVDEAGASGVYFYTVLCMKANGTVLCDYDHTGKKAAPVITPTVKQVTNGIKITFSSYNKAAKYRIFKKTGSGAWAKLTTTTNLTYTDKAVKDGKKYTYAVIALNASGSALTEQGSGVSITYKAAAKNVNFTLKSVATGVKISWDAYSGAGKYRVYRKNSDGSWATLATIKLDDGVLFYRDTSVADGKKYTYTVVAMTSGGSVLTEQGEGKSITYVCPVDASIVETEVVDADGNTVVIIADGDEISMDIIEVNPEDSEEVSEESEEEKTEDIEETKEETIEDAEESKEEITDETEESKEEITDETEEVKEDLAEQSVENSEEKTNEESDEAIDTVQGEENDVAEEDYEGINAEEIVDSVVVEEVSESLAEAS